MAGYYRRFIPRFSDRAKPLTDLTKKGVEWRWGEEQQAAFDDIKSRLTESPILAHPNFNEPFIVTTDASGFGVSAWLGQHDDDRKVIRPIHYANKLLHGSELNWSATVKEAAAVVFGVKQFRHYLEGHKFVIRTDHRALRYLFAGSDLAIDTPRLTRWQLFRQHCCGCIVTGCGSSPSPGYDCQCATPSTSVARFTRVICGTTTTATTTTITRSATHICGPTICTTCFCGIFSYGTQ